MIANITPCSFDPTRPDFAPYGLTCVRWQPSPMQRPDQHNEVELNLLKSGAITYLLGGEKRVVKEGRLSLFWAAIPHQIIDFAIDSEFYVATIPLQLFLQWRLPEEFVQPLMQGAFFVEDDEEKTHTDLELFESWEQDLLQESPKYERPVLLEMQARLSRFAYRVAFSGDSGVVRGHLHSVSDCGLSKVEKMACFIAQNYTRKLTVQEIGDHVNLHPNYAMNLFQKTFGTTLINYLTQHRISHAQRLLTTSDLPITEIGLRSGFLSISRFNEAFCKNCGCSPRQYRKSHELLKEPA